MTRILRGYDHRLCDFVRSTGDMGHATRQSVPRSTARCHSVKTGKAYIGTRPSKKKIAQICRAISELTGRRWVLKDAQDRVGRLNHLMIGWANYFCLGPVGKAYQAVDAHARYGLRRWLCRKPKVPGAGTSRLPNEFLYDKLGLVRLDLSTSNFPWATA